MLTFTGVLQVISKPKYQVDANRLRGNLKCLSSRGPHIGYDSAYGFDIYNLIVSSVRERGKDLLLLLQPGSIIGIVGGLIYIKYNVGEHLRFWNSVLVANLEQVTILLNPSQDMSWLEDKVDLHISKIGTNKHGNNPAGG